MQAATRVIVTVLGQPVLDVDVVTRLLPGLPPLPRIGPRQVVPGRPLLVDHLLDLLVGHLGIHTGLGGGGGRSRQQAREEQDGETPVSCGVVAHGYGMHPGLIPLAMLLYCWT